ncbi:MAG: ABC transporter ATP-binding protein [Bosea sp.]|mgnify:CR=1 FL=1|jgi:simple sugar transport system ATP-binding protein|nr:ABC transporter ATP-binding protein [Bosea sp. (in: a-proteobacteria)]
MKPFLEAIGIDKTYPGGVHANKNVDLTVAHSEVHAVVGENGAGKSTLMKILFGVEQPNAGEIRLDGTPITLHSPRAAIAHGIGMVFQHFSLVPSFTVAENVVLGVEPRNGLKMDRKRAAETVQALADRFRLPVDVEAPVERLPVGQQQRVEILKALYRDAKLLILDEPTAVLAPQEVEELFSAIRSLTAQGRTVLFIAHKLPEVIEISNTISVMRAGQMVGRVDKKDATEAGLARMMVGRDVALKVTRAKPGDHPHLCRISGLTIKNDRGLDAISGMDIVLRAGEIVGIAAVEGNGQSELFEAIGGLRPVEAGSVELNGVDIVAVPVDQRRDAGLAHIPEDRIATGSAGGASVAENIVATELENERFVRHGLLDLGAIRKHAVELIERFSVRVSGPDAAIGTLSGGNMQKVVVARELSSDPKLLLVSHPTRGVDLGATEFIWQRIALARDAGSAVFLTSADLSELLSLSDRMIVLYRGRIVAAFSNTTELTPEMLGSYMLGFAEQPVHERQAALA